MKVVLAKHAGTCYGVQRALDLAEEAAASARRVNTLGPLIHNPGAVRSLEEKGVGVVKSVQELAQMEAPECARVGDNAGETAAGEKPIVIIRSHGVMPEVYDELAELDVEVIDATCPHVARAQRGAAELAQQGCHVIVVGEEGHPEVEGLRAYAQREGANVDVVPSPADVPDNISEPLGVVAQTTQRRANFDAIMQVIQDKGVQPVVKNTICSATRLRQDAATALAQEVDAMVVIGGRNSSNTTRLAEICQGFCSRTYHIEASEELPSCSFEGCETVGVTAGASTPDDQITRVIDYLEAL